MYDHQLVEDLLKNADIVDVVRHYLQGSLIKKGKNYAAVCPFHDDHDPSLSVNTDLQIYKCFVCGHGGNAIRFVQEYEKISFPEAIRKTAEIVGFHDPRLLSSLPVAKIDPEKKRLYDCIADAQTFYAYMLSTSEGKAAKDYLAKRGMDDGIVEQFGIGYAPADGAKTISFLQSKGHSLKSIEDIGIGLPNGIDLKDRNAGRITFPLKDAKGRVVGFSARQLIKDPNSGKYVNSPETPIFHKGSVLYNYHNVSETARREGYCYVLEGFMDVIALDRAGLKNAVALMGTALTEEQVQMLRKLGCEIRLCLDGDNAGQMGMMKAISLFTRAKVPYRIVDYGGDQRDPDDIFQEGGKDALCKKMEHLSDGLEFQLSYYTNVKKLSTTEEKGAVIRHFAPLFALEDELTKENHIAKLAKALDFEPSALRLLVQKAGKEGGEEGNVRFSRQDRISPNAAMAGRTANRLAKAEDTILYYALSSEEARAFLQNEDNPLFSTVKRNLIFYILDYAKNNEDFDIRGLMSYIESQDPEEEYSGLIADLSTRKKAMLPYSERQIRDCQKAILEEKDKVRSTFHTEKALESGDKDTILAAINAVTEKNRERWKKK